LTKEGGSNKTWHKRFVVLDDVLISYYAKADMKKKKGEIFLSDVSDSVYVGDYGKHHFVFTVKTGKRDYFLKGATEEESLMWVGALSGVLHPSTTNTEAPPQQQEHKKMSMNDFEKMKVIGKGAFGKVYMVKKRDTGEVFAMKVLNKQDILEREEVEHTRTERSVLTHIDHPFLVKLHYSFQSKTNLFFVMDFINGGELFQHLVTEGSFSIQRTRFYAAQIGSGIAYLHGKGIIYRDIKPENILIDDTGNIIMTDFGLSKEGFTSESTTTNTFCGTPEYLAPEIVLDQSYTLNVDWWSFGVLIFEMAAGLPPFYDENEEAMYQKITAAYIEYPDFFPPDMVDLLSKLMDKNPNTRLSDFEVIKAHPFFDGIDFEKLEKKQLEVPYKPRVRSKDDVSNIADEFLDESISDEDPLQKRNRLRLTMSVNESFAGFTYGTDQ